jgi:hypothetical protein
MNASTRDTTLAPAPTVGHYRIDPVRTTSAVLHLASIRPRCDLGHRQAARIRCQRYQALSATVHAVLDAARFHTGYQRTPDGWKFAERLRGQIPRHHAAGGLSAWVYSRIRTGFSDQDTRTKEDAMKIFVAGGTGPWARGSSPCWPRGGTPSSAPPAHPARRIRYAPPAPPQWSSTRWTGTP